MTRRLLQLAVRLVPARFRDRYGEELAALLETSPRPLADTVDVLHLAALEHMEALMRRPLHTLAIIAFVASLVVFGYALNDLGSGLAEVPQHWWSSGVAVAVVASGATILRTRSRMDGPRDVSS
jgi:hypothetical protein